MSPHGDLIIAGMVALAVVMPAVYYALWLAWASFEHRRAYDKAMLRAIRRLGSCDGGGRS